jgi:hypothetical protein
VRLVRESLRAGCAEHWNKACWVTVEKTITLPSPQRQRLQQQVMALDNLQQHAVLPAPPGAETVSLRLHCLDRREEGCQHTLNTSFAAFVAEPRQAALRDTILSLADPAPGTDLGVDAGADRRQ